LNLASPERAAAAAAAAVAAAASPKKGAATSANNNNNSPKAKPTTKNATKKPQENNNNNVKPATTSTKPNLNIEENYKIRQRWVCQKKLGSGGFGEVWRAHDPQLKKTVAVKMEALTQSKQVLKMEVAVLKKLQNNSKHVCKLIDCGRNQVCNYMIMTLLGHSLADLRRNQSSNAFSVSTALRLSREMLFAIQSGFLICRILG